MVNNPQSMKCPYCKESFYVKFHNGVQVDTHDAGEYTYHEQGIARWCYFLRYQDCPACGQLIIVYEYQEEHDTGGYGSSNYELRVFKRQILYPKVTCNRTVAPEVPQQYADDFIEACNVFSVSPRGSAMLSRRLLQTILHQQYNITERTLQEEINTFTANHQLPTTLLECLHALREIGNIGAHPMKNQTTGDIINVDPEEAEWLLQLLEEIFDFAYVKPARTAAMKQSLNQKLQAAGRKTI